MSPGKRSPARPWAAMGYSRPHPCPLCRGADVPVSSCAVAVVHHAHRSEEHSQPRLGSISGHSAPFASPSEQAAEEPREPAVHPGLAPVTRAAQPNCRFSSVNALLSASGPHRPGDVDGEPVVQLVGGSTAALAHRHLDSGGLLSGCDPVGGQAVVVPCEMNRRGVPAAPAAASPDRLLPPARGPGDQSPGMRRRVSTVVHHQSPETSPPHPAAHALHAVIPPVDPAALSPALLSPIRPGICVRSDCHLKRGQRRSPWRVRQSRRRWWGLIVSSP